MQPYEDRPRYCFDLSEYVVPEVLFKSTLSKLCSQFLTSNSHGLFSGWLIFWIASVAVPDDEAYL